MSNYTEADVAQDEAALLEFIESGEHGRGAAIAMVSRLGTAALEGAKVPGLVEQVRHWRDAADEVAKNRSDEVRAYLSEVSALQARVAELERELEQERDVSRDLAAAGLETERQRAEAESERNALQARVAELEDALGEAEDWKHLHEAEKAAREEVVSERDALRAQVEKVRAGAEAAKGHSAWASRILATLSAPPAETTPAPERAE